MNNRRRRGAEQTAGACSKEVFQFALFRLLTGDSREYLLLTPAIFNAITSRDHLVRSLRKLVVP